MKRTVEHALICQARSRLHMTQIEKLHLGNANSWIVLDYGSVVVHVFSEEAREFYDLERLWQDGEKLELDFD